MAGFLLQKELDYLDGAVAQPKRPFVAIVGGSKVSSKIGVIESLINKVDKIILGCAVPTAKTPLRLCHFYRRLAFPLDNTFPLDSKSPAAAEPDRAGCKLVAARWSSRPH